jgi:excisionase family DNA binding protein
VAQDNSPRRKELMGLPQAAQYADVHARTIRRWIASGHLKAVRVGPRLIKVDRHELDAMLRPVGGSAA